MAQRANGWMRSTASLKRRGLMSGIAALVGAGLAKLGTAERADGAHQGSDEAIVHAGVENTTGATTIVRYPNVSAPAFVGSNAGQGFTIFPDGVQGLTNVINIDAAGVRGVSIANGTVGCLGQSNGHHSSTGVRGVSTPEGIGVHGRTTNGTAVRGDATGGGYGVHGLGNNSPGVYGQSVNGVGTIGSSTNNIGVYGASSYNVGVFGDADVNTAVMGRTGAGIGVYGTATRPQQGGRAAVFDGTVLVNGPFTVVGGPKSAGVKHPDGSVRRMYCQEGTEAYFEDVGRSGLVSGRSVVTLDPDFRAVVRGDDYDVLLTPRGDCNGLFVSKAGAGSFVVEELNGGKSSIPFSYRVMARRLDDVGKRMERVDVRPGPARDVKTPDLRTPAPSARPSAADEPVRE